MEEDGPRDAAGRRGEEAERHASVRPAARPSGIPGGPSVPPPSLRPPKEPRPTCNYRLVFAALWILSQMALVLTADRRSDGAFGFRMFSESSSMKLVLYREVGSTAGMERIRVDDGVWTAHSADGMVHRLTWYDRVPAPFWAFDREMHASYGAATQLTRLQGALDDVAAHVPNDAETRRFVLEVTVRRNGHEPVVHRLVSQDRMTSTPPSAEHARPDARPDVPSDGGP